MQKTITKISILFFLFFFQNTIQSQIVTVGSGSYTKTHPGVDAAGRNGFPSGSPQISGNALGKPVPTNDWWSKLVKENHADNLFNYPMTMKTTNNGLIVTYIPWGVIGDSSPIEVKLNGLNTTKATASDYSDWTVSMNWKDTDNELTATAGIGMPFLYFEKDANDVVDIVVKSGTVTVSNELLIIENASHGADFVFYAPSGSTWSNSGQTYSSTLNGKNYWSMAMLPLSTSNVVTTATTYQKFAYVFPKNTATAWVYDELSSKMTTTFTATTEVKEGTNSKLLMGLLPHQWDNLTSDSAKPSFNTYTSVRGQIKTLEGNSFKVENTFKGILPNLPYLDNYSDGFSPADLQNKISQIENDGLATWTDSYNEGQVMNRLIQTARIAHKTGATDSRDKMVSMIKNRLENWLKVQSSEVAFLFYYNSNWSSLIGYPSGHGQDNNINDHHFHWGYFIHAAAFMEQFEPGWATKWGPMINLLVRDAASIDRNDKLFPYLRSFSPYAGHSWANGFASFPQGNDQESTSESMQFASSLIHWGSITNNKSIRDLGIYIYTTEQTAIEEYWFDVNKRNFKPSQQYSVVSRVWGNSYDNGTFWTADIAASYGIEMYPMHAGSLYLGHNQTYAKNLWKEIATNTGILNNEVNANLWHDTYWKYLALTDAKEAIKLYNSNPNRNLKFGISDADTYHWIHAMNALGVVNSAITANHPIASSFIDGDGNKTYVAHNYSNALITVTFSDGFKLMVPANQMATSRDINTTGVLSSDFNKAFPGGSVHLTATVSGTGISKVEFFNGSTSIGSDTTAPYEIDATNLTLGTHGMYAKVYINNNFNVTNIISVTVGEQVPFSGNPVAIPGTLEAGNYDKFEGGKGQNISYIDTSLNNLGDYRTDEYMDASSHTSEGKTIGWVATGEWVEYTVDVQTAGKYKVDIRVASGNSSGGGPFHFETEGVKISSDIVVLSTGGWDKWTTKTVTNIPLKKGKQVLRVKMSNGEFNLGKMKFSYVSPLGYTPPVADAGDNVVVILPTTSTVLDGSKSNDPAGQTITYVWEQIYGPSIINFNSKTVVSPSITNLKKGVYQCKLTVNDSTYSSDDTVLILVQETSNSNPTISITAPSNNTKYREGDAITVSALASDLDGTITKVKFFEGTTKLGEDTSSPYNFTWNGASVGAHQIIAVATDDKDGMATSNAINISVVEVKSCTESSSVAQQGAFSIGYKATFETVGTDVTIKFELLDTDKVGIVAYLWKQTPFGEVSMDHISGQIYSKTIGGQTAGSTINYACKFAFAGGQSVTKYISYKVGDDCSASGGDTTPPANFTAKVGKISSEYIELLLKATEASGRVIYNVAYNGKTATVSGNSGAQTSLIINKLTPNTSYDFNISASDLTGNTATNNPIIITQKTLADVATNCSGSTSGAQQGVFSIGYNYKFTTNGTDVTIIFTLLDTDKTGVVAYLWRQTPFAETAMSNSSGLTFTKTITGQTVGSTINYGCKFAFAGGLAVTKYISYKVGDVCSLSVNDEKLTNLIQVFPNPASNKLYINSKTETIKNVKIYATSGKLIRRFTKNNDVLSIEDLSSGLYLLKIYTNKGAITKKILKK